MQALVIRAHLLLSLLLRLTLCLRLTGLRLTGLRLTRLTTTLCRDRLLLLLLLLLLLASLPPQLNVFLLGQLSFPTGQVSNGLQTGQQAQIRRHLVRGPKPSLPSTPAVVWTTAPKGHFSPAPLRPTTP